MKAYEKWAEQNMYDRTETKKTWRAALRWALTQETKKWLLGNNYHRYIDSIVIRNELED